jgi:WD40 repeat protein
VLCGALRFGTATRCYQGTRLDSCRSDRDPTTSLLWPVAWASWASCARVPSAHAYSTASTSQQWDTRQQSSLGPVVSMHSEKEQGVVYDIAVHPSHNYSVVATTDDGSVVVWDVRHPVFPQSITAVHRPEAPEVWQVRFNPVRPDHLFTAGEDGGLVHWDTTTSGVGSNGGIGSRSFSIGGDVNLTYLSQDCLGINALDVEPELVAYGNDEEKLVIVVPAY